MAHITEPTAEAGATITPCRETAAVRHSCYYNGMLSYDNTHGGDLQEGQSYVKVHRHSTLMPQMTADGRRSGTTRCENL